MYRLRNCLSWWWCCSSQKCGRHHCYQSSSKSYDAVRVSSISSKHVHTYACMHAHTCTSTHTHTHTHTCAHTYTHTHAYTHTDWTHSSNTQSYLNNCPQQVSIMRMREDRTKVPEMCIHSNYSSKQTIATIQTTHLHMPHTHSYNIKTSYISINGIIKLISAKFVKVVEAASHNAPSKVPSVQIHNSCNHKNTGKSYKPVKPQSRYITVLWSITCGSKQSVMFIGTSLHGNNFNVGHHICKLLFCFKSFATPLSKPEYTLLSPCSRQYTVQRQPKLSIFISFLYTCTT